MLPKSSWNNSPLTASSPSSVPTSCQIYFVCDAIFRFVVERYHWFSPTVVSCLCRYSAVRVARLVHNLPNHHYWTVYKQFFLRYSPLIAQSIHQCVSQLLLPKLIHLNPPSWLQSVQSPASSSWGRHCLCFLKQTTTAHPHSLPQFAQLQPQRYAPTEPADWQREQYSPRCCRQVL